MLFILKLVVLLLALFFILGSVVGSFLNVVVDRAIRGESILGRSYCDHCHGELATFDLIPILSFIALGRRCRYCRRPLSWQYPLVEAASAVLFAFSFWHLATSGELAVLTLAYYFFLVSVAILVFVVDLKFSLIPTTIVLFASLLALFYSFFTLPSSLFIEHVATAFGITLFFLAIVIVSRGRGMGEGDLFLAFLIGMVLGRNALVVAIFLAFLFGALVSLALIAVGKKRFGQTVPFGPFLISGFLVSLFWGEMLIDWYLRGVLV